MPASSAPISLRASGSNAPSPSRSASPTSAPATSAPSFRYAQPLSAKPRQDQDALTMLDARSTISSRSSEPRRGSATHRRLPRRQGPSDFPRGSIHSMERNAQGLAAWELPCCPVCCVGVPCPLPRRGRLGSSVWCSPSLQRPSRLFKPVGPRDVTFEACPGISRVTARRLADQPKAGLCPKIFDQSVTLLVVLVATGVSRRLPRQDLHLQGTQRLFTAH